MGMWLARKVNRKCKFKKHSKAIAIVNEEVYLRDDIRCGSPLCKSCSLHTPLLPFSASHYLLPNADALIQFWEILELPQISSVIFLTSVLKEVQDKATQRIWRKLRSIYTDQRRCNILFDDEHCIYTWLSRKEGASNYLEQVAEWFVNHLEGSIPVFLLTGLDSSAVSSNNVEVLDPDTYFKTYWSHDSTVSDLFTSLVLTITEAKDNKSIERPTSGKATYKEHLSASLLEAGISSGYLRVGIFSVSKHTPSEALVRPTNKGEASRLEISIPGRVFQNRALHGDVVAVRTFKKDSFEQDTEENEIVDEDILEENRGWSTEFAGEVVGIIQRVRTDYVACLVEEDESVLATARQEKLLCIPMDKRIPLVEIKTGQAQRLINQRFVLRIDNWEFTSRYPKGHLVRVLGLIGDLNAEVSAILIENGISTAPFSTLSLQELPEDTPANPWNIPEEEYASRRDIRSSHRCYSIDPPGSKDVDDVLSVSQLENGLLEIGVHIADVYFVKPGSLLDLEAKSRGTTVYMVGKSWHMLPDILSENLCSLIGGKDRLAVSVIWTLNPQNNFEVINTWFGRTIIRSRHQLFYAQAEAVMEGKQLPPGWEIKGGDLTQLQMDLTVLGAFAQNRRALRRLNGALELASTELRFEINDKREPVQVETKTELPMNWIVAEMMIFANACVAEKIYHSFPTCALLRKHSAPKLDSFTTLIECCEARGFTLDASSNKQLAASLDRLRESGDVVIERAFRALVTRAMSEAEYFSTGEELEPSQFYHYGLALKFYTHFTSPIRRYADILVHRMLIATCNRDMNILMSPTELQQVAEHLNEKHRASKKAQKECNELYLLMYLQKQAKAERGVVINITSKGIMVFVPKYDLRGLVHLEAIFDLGRAYKLMDKVWVRLRADGSRAHGPTLRMELLNENDPSVQEELLSYSISDLDMLKNNRLEIKLNANLERTKAIQAMVNMLATESSSVKPPPQRKHKRLTTVDVLQNISQAKAYSLFLDDNNASNYDTFVAALGDTSISNLVVYSQEENVGSAPLVDKENQAQLILRKKWQDNLAQAGIIRAKLTSSTSSDDSQRQRERAKKEVQARHNAHSIYQLL